MSDNFAANPDYSRYEMLLVQLHDLIGSGLGDSDQADALREQMVNLRDTLSPRMQARLDGLAADLYMLHDEEIFEQTSPDERDPEKLRLALDRAMMDEEWDHVLSLLRKGPDFLPPVGFATIRALCYLNLHHYEPAYRFARHAIQGPSRLMNILATPLSA